VDKPAEEATPVAQEKQEDDQQEKEEVE